MCRTCSVDGCDRPHNAKGLCKPHYRRLRTTGTVGDPEIRERLPAPAECTVDGCTRVPEAKGLCNTHYRRLQTQGSAGEAAIRRRGAPADPCAVDGCDRPASSRGLCAAHYGRLMKTGSVGSAEIKPKAKIRQPCSVEGCNRPSTAHGMCGLHAQRVRMRGTTELVGYATGPRHASWTGDDASYKAVHRRMARLLGKPSTRVCVECGATARDWSYQGGCPEEKQGTQGKYTVRYCLHPEHYVPRCRPCHVAFDSR